jgi:hypothetical protein
MRKKKSIIIIDYSEYWVKLYNQLIKSPSVIIIHLHDWFK